LINSSMFSHRWQDCSWPTGRLYISFYRSCDSLFKELPIVDFKCRVALSTVKCFTPHHLIYLLFPKQEKKTATTTTTARLLQNVAKEPICSLTIIYVPY